MVHNYLIGDAFFQCQSKSLDDLPGIWTSDVHTKDLKTQTEKSIRQINMNA